jgi:hypothetical protein
MVKKIKMNSRKSFTTCCKPSSLLRLFSLPQVTRPSADSNLFPPKAAILFAASWAYWPEVVLRYVGNLPFRQFIRFKDFLTHGKQLGKDLIENQAAAVDGKKRRDILSILGEPFFCISDWIIVLTAYASRGQQNQQ